MKINKQKHGKENTIGKIIYGFLMFMPLLAIAVTCAYVIFNKNAYQSYYGETINETIYTPLDQSNELKLDNEYNVNFGLTTPVNVTTGTLTISDISNFETSYTGTININEITSFYVGYNQSGNYNVFTLIRNNGNLYINLTQHTIKFDFTLDDISNYTGFDTFISNFNTISHNKDSFLSNVFYYSIDEVEQSPLFNWATETGTHNVLQSTCQTLGITTTFIPLLLAYWLMMSLMYLLYDIALLIVHMAHNRIHDIESSI